MWRRLRTAPQTVLRLRSPHFSQPTKPTADPMKPLRTPLIAAALACGIAACAQVKESGNRFEEGQLRAAGFKLMLADRADRQQMLRSLAPDTITRLQREGVAYYVYPDPDGCVCLYVGREAEYLKLQQLTADWQSSQQQLMYNDMEANSANGWGPWQ